MCTNRCLPLAPPPRIRLRAALQESVGEWPFLDQPRLVPSRSRWVCLTCHWFRHRAGADGIPLLTCQLHRGLITHGEHLTRCCTCWTDATAHVCGETLPPQSESAAIVVDAPACAAGVATDGHRPWPIGVGSRQGPAYL